MPTYVFEEIKRSKTVKFKCPCGRRFQRTVSACQTINPWNKTSDGQQKTHGQITDEVNAEILDLRPDPTCACGQTAAEVTPKVATR